MRPTGHHHTKARIINKTQAGLPSSSSFATIGMTPSRWLKMADTMAQDHDGSRSRLLKITMAQDHDGSRSRTSHRVTNIVNVNHIYIGTRSPGYCQGGQIGSTTGARNAPSTWRPAIGKSEAAQINEHACLEQLFRRHRQTPTHGHSPSEQRGDAVSERPHMQRHHEGWRSAGGGNLRHQRLRGRSQHGEGAVARLAQLLARFERNPGFEHGGIVRGLGASEVEIGPSQALEGG